MKKTFKVWALLYPNGELADVSASDTQDGAAFSFGPLNTGERVVPATLTLSPPKRGKK